MNMLIIEIQFVSLFRQGFTDQDGYPVIIVLTAVPQNSAFSHYEFNLLNVKQFKLLDLRKMMILRMILLGLTAADGFYSQTLNAVHHYRTGYYNRNGFSKCHCLRLFGSIKAQILI